MIMVGSQRGGSRQLATHLLNIKDNDHVTVQELRGFVSDTLPEALSEAQAVSKGTRCKQFLFSLSLNPPKDGNADLETLVKAADRAEEVLGLKGQPRAIILHEKKGRRHAHVVWSRIDAQEMKAINLPHFKNKLNALSKELFLENDWTLPDGYKTNGWKSPLNFTLAEWQQAKRLDLDPREIKQIFRESWEQSDNLPSFRHALEEHGYYLARGDRRGLVAVDLQGEVYLVSRWAGIRTKDLNARLGKADQLPSVDEVRQTTRKHLSQRLRDHVKESRENQAREIKPMLDERAKMVEAQRVERETLQKKQQKRWVEESQERAGRFRKGLFSAAVDLLLGRTRAIRESNDREAYRAYLRDRSQREDLYGAQRKDLAGLQGPIDEARVQHREERMRLTQQVVEVLRYSKQRELKERAQNMRGPSRGPEHDFER